MCVHSAYFNVLLELAFLLLEHLLEPMRLPLHRLEGELADAVAATLTGRNLSCQPPRDFCRPRPLMCPNICGDAAPRAVAAPPARVEELPRRLRDEQRIGLLLRQDVAQDRAIMWRGRAQRDRSRRLAAQRRDEGADLSGEHVAVGVAREA